MKSIKGIDKTSYTLPDNLEELDCIHIFIYLCNPYKYGDSIDQYQTIGISHEYLGGNHAEGKVPIFFEKVVLFDAIKLFMAVLKMVGYNKNIKTNNGLLQKWIKDVESNG